MDFDTGNRPDPAGSGGSGGGTGYRPPGAAFSPGGEFDFRDPIRSFAVTVRRLVLQPTDFFTGMRQRGDFLNPLVFAFVCYETFLVIGGIIGLLLGGLISASFDSFAQAGLETGISFGAFVVGLFLWPVWAVMALFVMAGIRHLLVTLFVGPRNAGFEATLRVNAYAAVSRLVWWVPFIGWLIGFIYSLYLYVVGIREVHSTTTGRAALIVLLPWAVIAVILTVLVALLGVAVFTVFQQQQL